MEGPKDANLSNEVFEDFSSGEDDHPEEEIAETVEDKDISKTGEDKNIAETVEDKNVVETVEDTDIEVKSSRNYITLHSHYHHFCCYY